MLAPTLVRGCTGRVFLIAVVWAGNVAAVATATSPVRPDDNWPQLQLDAARSGHTAATVRPPYRARWIWFGPDSTLRNKDTRPGDARWTDDLAPSAEGLRMPAETTFSFAGSMQPVISDDRVFVGDAQGRVYAISLDDGATLWSADNPGGTFWPAVATKKVVVFASLQGLVTAFAAPTGKQLWQFDTGKSITSAPAMVGDVVYVASQSGRVYALKIDDGALYWRGDYLGAPIQGGLCVAGGMVYVGTEAMEAVALDATNGKVSIRRRLLGQSFRMLWPVAVKDRVLFTVVPVICVGSEYVNDGVLAGRPDMQPGWVANAKSGYANADEEQAAMRRWLEGAGKPWLTCLALRADTLEQDYIVATGATEGCGTPPDPPAIDARGRPLLWWATAFPKLTRLGAFGTSYSIDLAAFDLATGKRQSIDNNRLSGQSTETDNLFGLTVGGNMVFLRQNFRGTHAIDLDTSAGSFISAVYRVQDGGTWNAAITYAADEHGTKRAPRTPASPAGRVAPAIVDGKLIFTEYFGVTCVETAVKPSQR